MSSDLPVGQPYFCPTSGDVEQPGRSGFDVCCDRPDLHEPVGARAQELIDKLTATIAAFPDAHNAANLAHARMERDALRAEVARVRAQTADAIIADLQVARRSASAPASQQSLEKALRIAARHRTQPAESVVVAPDQAGRPDVPNLQSTASVLQEAPED